MLDQIQQDGILDGREAHRCTVHRHTTSIAVDLEAIELDGRRFDRLCAAAVAGVTTELSMNARYELQRTERLDHVIVCTQ